MSFRPSAEAELRSRLPRSQRPRSTASIGRSGRSQQSGFTLLEALIVLAIIAIMVTFLIPNLLGELRKQRIGGHLTEVSNFMLAAKQEAVRRGVPVVITMEEANDRLFAFANVDNDPALAYQPDPAQTNRTVDYEVRRMDLPRTGESLLVDFWGPTDADPRQGEKIDGFTETTPGSGVFVAVFEPDGSIRDVGAFRFSDITHANSFEVRVAPAASARVQVLKYRDDGVVGPDGFYPRGIDEATGKNLWTWF